MKGKEIEEGEGVKKFGTDVVLEGDSGEAMA